MIPAEERLAMNFAIVRAGVLGIEEAIEQGGFSDPELKELDKAVVVIKAGAKLAKRVLNKRGYKKIGAHAKGLNK